MGSRTAPWAAAGADPPDPSQHNQLNAMGVAVEQEDIVTAPLAARMHLLNNNLRPLALIDDTLFADFEGVEFSNPNAVMVGLAPDKFDYAHVRLQPHHAPRSRPRVEEGARGGVVGMLRAEVRPDERLFPRGPVTSAGRRFQRVARRRRAHRHQQGPPRCPPSRALPCAPLPVAHRAGGAPRRLSRVARPAPGPLRPRG